jgi:hypothetical protein
MMVQRNILLFLLYACPSTLKSILMSFCRITQPPTPEDCTLKVTYCQRGSTLATLIISVLLFKEPLLV